MYFALKTSCRTGFHLAKTGLYHKVLENVGGAKWEFRPLRGRPQKQIQNLMRLLCSFWLNIFGAGVMARDLRSIVKNPDDQKLNAISSREKKVSFFHVRSACSSLIEKSYFWS